MFTVQEARDSISKVRESIFQKLEPAISGFLATSISPEAILDLQEVVEYISKDDPDLESLMLHHELFGSNSFSTWIFLTGRKVQFDLKKSEKLSSIAIELFCEVNTESNTLEVLRFTGLQAR